MDCYGVTVAAVNDVDEASNVSSMEFTLGSCTSGSMLDYPYFYILIPGFICLAIIVVITIVICKKLHEKRKGSVGYVTGEAS